jgi:hypothetical protein
MGIIRGKIEKIVYDISFIRYFVAPTPSWHSSQARRALNPCVLQNASYKTHILLLCSDLHGAHQIIDIKIHTYYAEVVLVILP